MSHGMQEQEPNRLRQLVPTIVWVIVGAVLVLGTQIQLEPKDYKEVLKRTGIPTVSVSSETVETVPIGQPMGADTENVLEVRYFGCVGEADDNDAFRDPRFFSGRQCEIVIQEGEAPFHRLVLENKSDVTLTNFNVTDKTGRTISPDDECWTQAIPTVANRDPEQGWGGGTPGELPPGELAACIYGPDELSESQEDPYYYNLDVTFNAPDAPAAEIASEGDGEGDGEQQAGGAAGNGSNGDGEGSNGTDGSGSEEGEGAELDATATAEGYQGTLEQPFRLIYTLAFTPDLWLPTFGLSGNRVIDVGDINTGISLFWFAFAYAALELVMNFYIFKQDRDKIVRPLIRVAAVFIVFWSFYGHEIVWDNALAWLFPKALAGGEIEILDPDDTIIGLAGEHLELVFVSSGVIIPLGLAIGIFVTRATNRKFLPLVTNIVNLGQTIPTLAVVAIMAPIIGFGFTPALIALIIYGLLPVVRNTIAGLENVDNFIIDSARGMGMTPSQILFRIELPIASAVIMAGIRTSTVINVGTAALGAYVISGGLGHAIANGLLRSIDPWILLGAIPAALLAVLIDYILGRIEFVITPRGLQL